MKATCPQIKINNWSGWILTEIELEGYLLCLLCSWQQQSFWVTPNTGAICSTSGSPYPSMVPIKRCLLYTILSVWRSTHSELVIEERCENLLVTLTRLSTTCGSPIKEVVLPVRIESSLHLLLAWQRVSSSEPWILILRPSC